MRRRTWPPKTPCVDCGAASAGLRCMACYRRSRPAPVGRRADLDDWKARDARKRAVKAWRATQGDYCPGFEKPPHPASDLTADHPLEVVLGGDPRPGEYSILCRSCNARKSHSNMRRARDAASQMLKQRYSADRDW